MRKVVVIAAAVLLVPVVLLIVQGRARSADLKWDYDYVRDPPCTDTRTKNCVRGFNAFVGDASSHPKPVFVPNRLDDKGQFVSKGIGTTVSVETSGDVKFCVTAVGADATGVTVESRPICVSKFVVPFVTQKVRISGRQRETVFRLARVDNHPFR